MSFEIAASEVGTQGAFSPTPCSGCLSVATPSSVRRRASVKEDGVEDVKLFGAAARYIARLR